MKYLGIDYGGKSVGFAVSDSGGMIAFPHEVVPNNDKLLSYILERIEKDRIGTIVVGDTRVLSGQANPITAEADEFKKELKEKVGIPVETIWEMWSSIEASRFAPKGEEHNDAAAAAVILQRYLDSKG